MDALGRIYGGGEQLNRDIGRIRYEHRRLSGFERFRESAADLIQVASAVYHADRRARRSEGRRSKAGLSWLRNIRIEVAVREPARWALIGEQLERLLWELTCDRWEFRFTRSEVSVPLQGDLFTERLSGAEEIALFSGGLDSAAGPLVYSRQCERPLYAFHSDGVPVRGKL